MAQESNPSLTPPANPQQSDNPNLSKSAMRARAEHARKVLATLKENGLLGKMSREQAIKHLERLLKSKETPIQYHAALMSQLADLNSWKRQADDTTSRTSIGEMLQSWKREDSSEYAGLMNQQANVGAPTMHPQLDASTNQPAQLSTVGDRGMGEGGGAATTRTGGEPPSESTAAEALDPLSPRHNPEKLSQPVDSKVVNTNQPEDGWTE